MLVLLELNARVLQEVHGVLGVHVLGEVEAEVELPRGDAALGQIAALVQEGQAELDDLEEVDVAAKELVLVVS